MKKKLDALIRANWYVFAIAALLIIYLPFANVLIAKASDASFFMSKKELTQFEKKGLCCSIDEISAVDEDLMCRIHIKGWACCRGEEVPDEKKIGIVLADADGTNFLYVSDPSYERVDVNALIGNKSNSGFDFAPSLILVPDGTYELLIYCYECEGNYGISRTGYELVKSGKEITISQQEFSQIDFVGDIQIRNDAEIYVDTIQPVQSKSQTTQERMLVKGWAFIPEKPSGLQKVYLCATRSDGTRRFFLARPANRIDVVDSFKNDAYWTSGFEAELDDAEDCKIGVFVENEDGLHTSTEMILDLGLWQAEKSELGNSIPLEDVKYYVDSANRREDGWLTVNGWAFVPEQDPRTQKTYVRLKYPDGEYDDFSTLCVWRKDVAEAYNNELYQYSGFATLIPAQALRSQDFTVSVMVKNATGLHG